MQVIRSIKEMQQMAKELRREGNRIGYVPTMGFLHEGHLTLINEAKKNNDKVVISIFVNPLQFGPNEDFDAYPRDIERDETLANNAGVDFIFYPEVGEMYPVDLSTKINVTKRVNVLCGKSREGHFDGVATVLMKLFNIIMPDRAYFGLKDAQQVAVVDGLINDYNIPVELVAVVTVREEDGLAKSSRNVYLTEQERSVAPELYRSLQKAVQRILDGEKNLDQVKTEVINAVHEKTSGIIDYVEIYSYPDLVELNEPNGKMIIALAVKFSKARLIDNITFSI
ncbi:pantothenate synthetase [Schinkia azotoformans MEV2011]|uniref:Pantothenate synthetase n=1 Tax=Schinkia azotoformans MEV2011 TaxID=1348973 RepID=A0A072NUG7_SCHAZ|nr:pantoate--beta-alanine ligase [Schinkia azotoformans]KEF40513.1 pantothenate synthetase [Schinkia azotoformans MEV2011]MEC1696080.1 pantoate--beta-alanine ligase [Schinkia azotoformans]MEC1716706.1 pantoate--beta-alanine ligase [Schinkia azotoformans]MEC1725417.1 pantoate--beta-alanine ligase [Schinkia azotoformans]MEC1739545.1 pantoate--beta-alanine ligase [Schinkia azotoformans]